MGFLRFILAAAVVSAHSTAIVGLPMIRGELAVKGFFIISGFYMTLILDAKYEKKRHSLWLFYSNRFLRIYPMYYVTLLMSIAFYIAAAFAMGKPVDRLQYWVQASHLGLWFPLLLLVLIQVLIVGIETTWFFAFSAKEGFSLATGAPGETPCWIFCFLPQSWSIGIELIFYALVPYLIHVRKRVLWSFVAINLIGIVVLTVFGNNPVQTVFLDHFFPLELGYFCLGILGYRHFYKKPIAWAGYKSIGWCVVGAVFFTTFAFGLAKNSSISSLCDFVYAILIFLGVPFLFQLTKDLRVDRFIGELSYPMYLTHVPVKWILLSLVGVSQRATHAVPGIELLLGTMVVSVLMVFCIDYPVDRWRQRRANNG